MVELGLEFRSQSPVRFSKLLDLTQGQFEIDCGVYNPFCLLYGYIVLVFKAILAKLLCFHIINAS